MDSGSIELFFFTCHHPDHCSHSLQSWNPELVWVKTQPTSLCGPQILLIIMRQNPGHSVHCVVAGSMLPTGWSGELEMDICFRRAGMPSTLQQAQSWDRAICLRNLETITQMCKSLGRLARLQRPNGCARSFSPQVCSTRLSRVQVDSPWELVGCISKDLGTDGYIKEGQAGHNLRFKLRTLGQLRNPSCHYSL